MAVYVDNLCNWGWHRGPSCHMIADSVSELIEFAISIGLRPEWYQPKSSPHFDLTEASRRWPYFAAPSNSTAAISSTNSDNSAPPAPNMPPGQQSENNTLNQRVRTTCYPSCLRRVPAAGSVPRRRQYTTTAQTAKDGKERQSGTPCISAMPDQMTNAKISRGTAAPLAEQPRTLK